MTLTLTSDHFYYVASVGAIIYLFWESWLCLIKKDKHITLWAKFQLWILEKSYGIDAMNRKKAELTSAKHLRNMGIEALILGVLLLTTFFVKLAGWFRVG